MCIIMEEDEDSYFEAMVHAATHPKRTLDQHEETDMKPRFVAEMTDDVEEDNYFEAMVQSTAYNQSSFVSEDNIIWQDFARQVASSSNGINDIIPGLFLLTEQEASSFMIVEQWLHSFLPQSAMFYNVFRSSLSSNLLFFVDNRSHPNCLFIITYFDSGNTAEVSIFSPYKVFDLVAIVTQRLFKYLRLKYYVTEVKIVAIDPLLYDSIFKPELYQQSYYNVCYTYFLESAASLAKIPIIPANYSVSPLSLVDAETINGNWKFRSPGSIVKVRRLVEIGFGRAIRYRNPTNNQVELVAWCVVYEDGALGMLYTVENHRGHGLARIVVHAVVSNLLKILSNHEEAVREYGEQFVKSIGSGPFCHTEANNIVANSLFTSLGFEKCCDVVWAKFDFL